MMSSKKRPLLAMAAVPLLGLAALGLVTATPIAAQPQSVNKKPSLKLKLPKAPQCYNPGGHAASVAWMGDHPDRPLHKGCPPSVGKAIDGKCYTCDGVGILDASKWCHTPCKAGTVWNTSKRRCCG
jgi:hypothetical protein